MNTSVASSPYFKVYLASQVHANDKGFLSKEITVRDLITHRGGVSDRKKQYYNKLPARMHPFGRAELKSQITNRYQITMSEKYRVRIA